MGNGVGGRLPNPSAPKKQFIFRQKPISGFFTLGERARATEVALGLVTVHPNPGPGGRQMSAEGKARRDCQVRTWRVSELNRMQRFMDRAYRYVWRKGNEPPLMQMQREGKNMADIQCELGVMLIWWKVEKRVLAQIGHVMRMEGSRMVKAVVLGWIEQLER